MSDGVNRGKQFEAQIKKAFLEVPETSVCRLQDTMNGFRGSANICDFIVYHYPVQLFIECKSCHGNRLPLSNISNTQWRGLLEQNKIRGVRAGYMIWWIDKDVTMFIPASAMQMYEDDGNKSVPYKNFPYSSYIIPGKKRQILYDYDMTEFLEVMCHVHE